MEDNVFAVLRDDMVKLIGLYVQHASAQIGKEELNARVLEAMARVPRHEFVPLELRAYAYVDGPLPIGFEKTVSQPFIVALMTDLLEINQGDKILEIGTGLGYHAAIMTELGGRVFTVEIIEELGLQAQKRLKAAGYGGIEFRIGDGSRGWPEHAPFDRILVAAAPELIPAALLHQLKPGGRMVVPAGIADAQQLMVVGKDEQGKVSTREILPVRFSSLESYH